VVVVVLAAAAVVVGVGVVAVVGRPAVEPDPVAAVPAVPVVAVVPAAPVVVDKAEVSWLICDELNPLGIVISAGTSRSSSEIN